MSRDTVIQVRGREIGPGTQLNDLYQIDELITEGGMGAVFRGHSIETGDLVAIKTIRPDFAENANALTLFRKEAAALHNVYHGAVVRYYVFSIDRRIGVPYLAMEYVTGEALSDRLKRGPLDFEGVDLLRRRIADGLQAAHDAGIVHRDVSPDNVILPGGDPGRAKIIDFGIARSAAAQTVIGDGFAGKYGYVSPEQFGLQGGEVTAKSDIYSLGLVLAEASRGRPIDMGDTPAAFISRRGAVPDLTGVDPRLVPLLEMMLRPDPRMRPQSMAEVAAWAPPPPPRGRPASPGEPRRGPSRGIVLGAGGAGLAVAACVAVVLLQPSPKPPSPSQDVALVERTARPNPPPERGEIADDAGATASGTEPPREPSAAVAPPARGQSVPPQPPASRPAAEPRPAERTQATERTQTATIDPQAVPAQPDRPSPTMEQVAAYIRGYRGGDCFFLSPTAISGREASVEAYGAEARPFAAFDAAFKAAFGFEAHIVLHQVQGGQCPVVELLARQAQVKPASAPKIRIENDRIRSGEDLKGLVDFGEGTLTLLLVEGDGSVHDLAPYLRRSARQAVFSARLDAGASDKGRPQLLVAVVSRAPLPVLEGKAPKRSDRVFQEISQEAARPGSGVSLTVSYIKVGS